MNWVDMNTLTHGVKYSIAMAGVAPAQSLELVAFEERLKDLLSKFSAIDLT